MTIKQVAKDFQNTIIGFFISFVSILFYEIFKENPVSAIGYQNQIEFWLSIAPTIVLVFGIILGMCLISYDLA